MSCRQIAEVKVCICLHDTSTIPLVLFHVKGNTIYCVYVSVSMSLWLRLCVSVSVYFSLFHTSFRRSSSNSSPNRYYVEPPFSSPLAYSGSSGSMRTGFGRNTHTHIYMYIFLQLFRSLSESDQLANKAIYRFADHNSLAQYGNEAWDARVPTPVSLTIFLNMLPPLHALHQPWPARQRIRINPFGDSLDALRSVLEIQGAWSSVINLVDCFPEMVSWHPWLSRKHPDLGSVDSVCPVVE